MAKKIKIGDVFELRTGKGLAYAQCTHHHDEYEHLVRVLPGFFTKRPRGFQELVGQPTRFCTFVALQTAVNKKAIEIVANEAVPPEAQTLPRFRNGVPNKTTNKVDTWWLWDGERQWLVGILSEEQRRLPILGTVTEERLIEQIVSGWTPETDSS
jgi:hypothetical protein